MASAIEFKNVAKKFGNFYANENITFEVVDNEIHALLGENGAGKSTLMNLLFGIYNLDEGEILVGGEKVNITNPRQANDLKIAMVHQHFQLVDTFSVAQNVVLGNEKVKNFMIDQKQIDKEVQAVIDKYNFDLKATDIVGNLTIGQQQKVEILKMLFIDAKYLIFDEPSGALTPQETQELLEIMKKLKSEGKTIILITHKLEEIKQVADRCTVIRKGNTIKTVNVSEVDNHELAHLMVGESVEFEVKRPDVTKGEPILEVKGLNLSGKLKNINLNVHAGEIVAIAGVDGNGQTELIEAIMGLRKYDSGKVLINGVDVTGASTKRINQLGVGYVPQDRQRDGLILDFDLAENAVIKKIDQQPYSKRGLLSDKAIKEYGQQLVQKYDVRANDGINSTARSLSGGNQQKLIIGREIDSDPKLLILVQPTRGVDVGAISNIHKEIMEQLAQQKAILLVSLELEEIMQLADQIYVIHDGEFMGKVKKTETSEKEIGLMMAGQRVKEA